nr:MAG TPA: DNA polymerase B [Caudoviricetes sp.]
MQAYTADFETITNPNDCRVWAVALCEIETERFSYGNNIEFLFEFMQQNQGTYYFHNLKFDGEFIIYYLLTHGYKYVHDRKKLKQFSFNILMSDTGQFYSMEIGFDVDAKGDLISVKIIDSLKIIPLSVDAMSKAFGLPISKLHIDYDADRQQGHELTQEEIEYIQNDVVIVAKSLKSLFEQNLRKQTQGSNALADYKKILGAKNFKRYFPIIDYDIDADIRKSYKGGFTYLNPKYKSKQVKEGIVLDVNSLYPYVLYTQKLPYGTGIHFDGEYQPDELFNVYIQKIRCQFELKEGHIPCIQLKHNLMFISTEYLSSSNDEIIEMTLTNVDLELIKQQYDLYNVEYLGGWKFRSTDKLFKDYIDKWYAIKRQATIDGNKGLRTIAKLMQNALYGKFGLNPNICSKYPVLENGIVKYKNEKPTIRDSIYIPVATFCTAYARYKTITSAQMVSDRFIYADTDSLHLEGTEIPEGLQIDDVELGAWKIESKFTRAKFIRQKTYIEEIDGKLNITCAGMPKTCYEEVTYENFEEGATYGGKLRFIHVAGGQIPEKTTFTITKG